MLISISAIGILAKCVKPSFLPLCSYFIIVVAIISIIIIKSTIITTTNIFIIIITCNIISTG